MIDEKKLPQGWEIVKVSNVAKLYRGINYTKDVSSNFPFKDGLPILRGNNINMELNFDDLVYVPKSLIKVEQLVKKDDIIFAMSSGSKHLVGKTAVAKSDFNGSYGAFCGLLRVDDSINKKYISLIFKGNAYRKLISEIAKGTSINNLKREHILDFEFPLPPLPTQQLIVSKIEKLFSELDKGIENLKTAQKQLKTYRQAVLKWAFEGKLTNKNIKDGELPKGWKMVSIEDVAKVGTGATPLKGNKKYYENGKIAWITSGALNDEYVREATDYVTELALKETNLSLYPKHTLLLAMYGEGKTRGKCSELLIEASTNQAIAAISFENHDMKVKPFLKYFLLKNYNDIRMLSSGGVQPNLNLGIVKKTLFPFPANDEQNLIIQEIESRLSVADKMEESINQSLQQAEALRQSILKKAFEGKLV